MYITLKISSESGHEAVCVSDGSVCNLVCSGPLQFPQLNYTPSSSFPSFKVNTLWNETSEADEPKGIPSRGSLTLKGFFTIAWWVPTPFMLNKDCLARISQHWQLRPFKTANSLKNCKKDIIIIPTHLTFLHVFHIWAIPSTRSITVTIPLTWQKG